MATTNLEKYRADLHELLARSCEVQLALYRQAFGHDRYLASEVRRLNGDVEAAKKAVAAMRDFGPLYQIWYSEALVLVKQLMPDRLPDFIKLYEKPKNRRDITNESYRIEDACHGIQTTLAGSVTADSKAAVNLLDSQIAIVEAIKRRFESSLFDIKQMVQADLFDSELGAASELLKSKYIRAAGALAGVVLEGHLKQVCDNHSVPKKSGTIAVLNDALKAADVIQLPQHRHIQYLGDIRNKCGHKNADDPTQDEVADLIAGVDKVIKTIF